MRAFINELSEILNNEQKELIEIDLILSSILFELSQNKFFSNNFLLKGGTCLIKCYLDYYRFSEDLDFTFKNQELFRSKSKKEKRELRSKIINEVGNIIEEICRRNNLDFKNDKSNNTYFRFQSNQFFDLKIYYNSNVINVRKMLKIQINLIECLKYQFIQKTLKSIIPEKRELEFLFPNEYKKYRNEINIFIYDIREILCEKVRAILTRRDIKPRDLIDVYFIVKAFDFNIYDFKSQIINKTKFVLKFEKFKKNFKDKKRIIETDNLFDLGEEKRLLLCSLDYNLFNPFLEQFKTFLKELIKQIS